MPGWRVALLDMQFKPGGCAGIPAKKSFVKLIKTLLYLSGLNSNG